MMAASLSAVGMLAGSSPYYIRLSSIPHGRLPLNLMSSLLRLGFLVLSNLPLLDQDHFFIELAAEKLNWGMPSHSIMYRQFLQGAVFTISVCQ